MTTGRINQITILRHFATSKTNFRRRPFHTTGKLQFFFKPHTSIAFPPTGRRRRPSYFIAYYFETPATRTASRTIAIEPTELLRTVLTRPLDRRLHPLRSRTSIVIQRQTNSYGLASSPTTQANREHRPACSPNVRIDQENEFSLHASILLFRRRRDISLTYATIELTPFQSEHQSFTAFESEHTPHI